jgi:hypothetical protein
MMLVEGFGYPEMISILIQQKPTLLNVDELKGSFIKVSSCQ